MRAEPAPRPQKLSGLQLLLYPTPFSPSAAGTTSTSGPSRSRATQPSNKERHFIVTSLERDDEDVIIGCILESVLTKNTYQMSLEALKDEEQWSLGWK